MAGLRGRPGPRRERSRHDQLKDVRSKGSRAARDGHGPYAPPRC